MHYDARISRGALAIALAAIAPLTTGCETLKDHVELGAIEMHLEHFDAANNKLEALRAPEVKRIGAKLIGHSGKLFIIAGLTPTPEAAKDLEIFDPATGALTQGAPWQNAEALTEVVSTTSTFCAVRSVDKGAKQLDCYDPKANTWSTLPATPITGTPAIATLGDDIYIAGDDTTSDSTPGKAFRFDGASASWKAVADLPASCAPRFLRAIDKNLYAFGCSADYSIIRYEPALDAWTNLSLTGMPDAMTVSKALSMAETAGVVSGEVVFFDSTPNSNEPTVAVFDPTEYDQATMKSGVRFKKVDTNDPMGTLIVTETSSAFWALTLPNSICGELHSYDPMTDTWTKRVDRPSDQRFCQCDVASLGDEVFVLSALQEKSVAIN